MRVRNWSVVTPPSAEPVSLIEAKAHLRVDGDDEDALITLQISAVREQVELEVRRSLMTQTLAVRLAEWPYADRLTLPQPPLQSVTHIKYTDDDGTLQTMAASDYIVYAEPEPGHVMLKASTNWPSADLQPGESIVITYVAGYGGATAVPARYKQAILLWLGHWYENRESVVVGTITGELPMAVRALLDVDRGNYQ